MTNNLLKVSSSDDSKLKFPIGMLPPRMSFMQMIQITSCCVQMVFFFFKIFYLFEREREHEHGQGEGQRKKEKLTLLSRVPHVGLDPRTPGS